jgi:glycosyltransferase involved in cell wall biosynthesis
MNVWLLKIGEPVPDGLGVRKLRTAMLGDELHRRGHRVLWWNSSYDHHQKEMRFRDDAAINLAPGFDVRTLRGMSYASNFSLRRYLDHRIIARKFRQRARRESPPDIIVAAMPDYHLAAEAVRYGRERGIPVLVDVRDQWPDVFVRLSPRPLRGLVRRALRRDYGTLAVALRGATCLVAMTTGLLAWALRHAGRAQGPLDEVFFLGAPPLAVEAPAPTPRLQSLAQRAEGRFVVTFIGTFGHAFRPEVVARTARLLHHSDPGILFVLAGDGPFRKDLEERSRDLPNVLFPGWLNNDEILALLAVSGAGVVPSNVLDDVFPNKAFTYLSAGLPVLSSDDGDLRRLLETHNAGRHFVRDDAEELARHVRALAGDAASRARFAQNARQLFRSELESGAIYRAFTDHIERVAKQAERL